jgi:hypothetical protein
MRLLALGAIAACSYTAPLPGELERGVLVDDTPDDFVTGELIDGVVTPWGTLEPAAFVIGGLHARAFAGNQVAADDTFEAVAAKLGAAIGAGYRQLLVDHGAAGRPRGLGLARSTDYTVLYEGEILLSIGIQELEVVADDRAVVELALNGVVFGQRVASSGSTAKMPLDVRQPGWFPIRIAYGQGGGAARVVLTTVQNQNRTPVGPDRLRARVTDHAGVVAFGFDSPVLVLPRGETALPSIDAAYGLAAPPIDLDLGIDRFSIRYAGQLRIDDPGSYTFRAELAAGSDDSYRLWIDDQLVATSWPGSDPIASGTLDLAAGWHDLVFDHADGIGNAEVRLRMNDAPIEPERLRPAVARGLVASHVVFAETPIPDDDQVSHPLTIVAPSAAVIDSVDYGFGLHNHRTTDLTVELTDCMDPSPLPASTATPLVPSYHYFSNDARCAGAEVAPSPPWRLTFIDDQPGNGGLLGPVFWNPVLVASYHGGERTPFARSFVYVSEPKPVPGVVAIAAARVVAESAGARVELAVRAAPDAETLVTRPWTVVVDKVALPTGSELVQYQLVVSGDGWQYAKIDRVELEYLAAAR